MKLLVPIFRLPMCPLLVSLLASSAAGALPSSASLDLSGRPCGFPPAGKPTFKDRAFVVDAASMAAAGPGGVWRYHSSPPFTLKGGQVNMQDQIVALATPSGALGLSRFTVVAQEFDEVLGNWVEVKPSADTYLHHFTVDNTFSSKDYNDLSITEGGEGFALTCRNNAAFEAGNGGSGARVYDFGDHYISDAGRRVPSWPAGNISLWHFGWHLLNLQDVSIPFNESSQCKCATGRGWSFWQDAPLPLPTTERARLARHVASPRFPSRALRRRLGDTPALNGSIICCKHDCHFPTHSAAQHRPPKLRQMRFELRLRWALPSPAEQPSAAGAVGGAAGRRGGPLMPMMIPATMQADNGRKCDLEFNLPQCSAAEAAANSKACHPRIVGMEVVLQHQLDVVAIVPHFHVYTTEMVLEASLPAADGTEPSTEQWRIICGAEDNVEYGPGHSTWKGPPCEFKRPLRLLPGTRLRGRHRHDVRHSALLGAMSANTLYFSVDEEEPRRPVAPLYAVLHALKKARDSASSWWCRHLEETDPAQYRAQCP